MKTIKNLIITGILGVLLIGAVTTETIAWPKVRIAVGPKVVKPGPNFIWIEGHYKRNAFGRLVWVPGHWKKV